MGSGKSTVAGLFAEQGAVVIDADTVVHELLAGPAERAVLDAFPESAGPDGRVDRARLGAAVFPDPARRQALERLLHPLVVRRSEELVEAARRSGAPMA